MKRHSIVLFPLMFCGFFGGFAGTQLYFHNMWAALGFIFAAIMSLLLHLHVQFISKLLLANHIMSDSLKRLLHDLEEAGILVTHVEVEGDVDTTTAKLVRKDLH